MSDSSRGKRRRTPSPEESRRDNRHKWKRSHSRRRENNSSVNEALTQVLASMQDMKKEFTAWTKRVDNIELQLNANSSVRQLIPDEDYLSVHPTASPFTSEEVDVPHGNGAIEAPLAGPEPPLADVGSDYSHSNVSKERLDNHGPEQPCEFFDPEDTILRKWSVQISPEGESNLTTPSRSASGFPRVLSTSSVVNPLALQASTELFNPTSSVEQGVVSGHRPPRPPSSRGAPVVDHQHQRVNGSPIHPPPATEMVITSDASKMGWGATFGNLSTNGRWSKQESDLHINVLELKATFLAIQAFLKNQSNLAVKLRLDNTTAVTYVNNQGGTRSPSLTLLTLELWNWCLQRNILIAAEHLPGASNVLADRESRTFIDSSDWKLQPEIIQYFLKDREIDLFATRLTNQLKSYVSWRPDPHAVATDAFSIDWSQMKGYAFPPFNLIPRTLMKVINDNANIVLVAPVWQTQHWWPLLLQLTVQLLSSATRQSTNKSYDCAWTKWNSWCNRRKVNPISATVKDILTFLSDQFDNNLQYRTVNVLRSAILSIHPWIEGKPVGQHPLVIRLMKGIANERPPKPRYTTTWDVAEVTTYLSALGENKTLSLKLLTKKLLMLLALVSPERASVLWELDIRYLKKQPDGVVFTLIKPRKSGDPMSRAKATFPRFLQDTTLCPCDCLETYSKATEKFRLSEDSNKLFLSFQRPHHPVAKATATRWLCDVLIAAGIDSTIFKAHSTRAASTSAAAKKHLPLDDILKMGDWTLPSPFQRFYYKPIIDDTYAKTVLTH